MTYDKTVEVRETEARPVSKMKFWAEITPPLLDGGKYKVVMGIVSNTETRARLHERIDIFEYHETLGFDNQVRFFKKTFTYTGTDYSKTRLRKLVGEVFAKMKELLEADVDNPHGLETRFVKALPIRLANNVFDCLEELESHGPASKTLKRYTAVTESMVYLRNSTWNRHGQKPLRNRDIAAMEATNILTFKKLNFGDVAMEAYTESNLLQQKVKHPLTGKMRPLGDVIVSLNDTHEVEEEPDFEPWTFEMIADWLETLDVNITLGSRKELENV